jgi:hypothetical protein
MDRELDPRQALAAFEAEKARRLQAKVDAGKLVRVPLQVVVGTIDEMAEAVGAAMERKTQELRGAGETRPIHFDKPRVIVTGIPRAPDFNNSASSASVGAEPAASAISSDEHSRPTSSASISSAEPTASEITGLKPPPVVSSPSEPKYCWVQTRECEDSLDAGEIKEARWYVADGEVVLLDMEGNWLASQPLFPNQSPAALARTLLRSVDNSDNSFNRKFNISRSYSGMH